MMMADKFDAADYLDSPESIAAYLTEALDTNDPSFVEIALRTVSRARAISPREGATSELERLAKSLDEQAHPEFETIRRALSELGVRLVAEPAPASQ